MKKIFLLPAICSALLLSSCTTVYKTADTADVKNHVNTYPEVADLDVQAKVTKTMTWSFRPFYLGEPKKSTAKGNLISDVLKENNADVLLEPQFHFEKTQYGQRTLTVSGYPATYKNFRKATDADLNAIKVCTDSNEKKQYNHEKSGFLFKIFK